MAKNWAELPRELLGRILERLCLTSIDSFKDVCKPWYSSVREEVDLSLLRPVLSPPWLTIPQLSSSGEASDSQVSSASFFNLTNEKVYFVENNKKKRWPPCPKQEAVCVGSCHGWLAFVDFNIVIYLMNPFKPDDDVIQLPPIQTLPCILGVESSSSSGTDFIYWHWRLDETYIQQSNKMFHTFITKLVMSSAPEEEECTVMVIYGELDQLAICKPGDKSWTTLVGNLDFNGDLYYSSTNQQFYVLCKQSTSFEVWDLRDFTSPKSTCIYKLPYGQQVPLLPLPPSMSSDEQGLRTICSKKIYLAELYGNLLLVVRYFGDQIDGDGQIIANDDFIDYNDLGNAFPYKTLRFDVYKLDLGKKQWVQVKCLGDNGDCVLFLGINNAIAFSTCDFPGLQGNSIYFTDNYDHYYNYMVDDKCTFGGHDLGIFSIEDNSIHPCYYSGNFKKISPPPVWISPNPW